MRQRALSTKSVSTKRHFLKVRQPVHTSNLKPYGIFLLIFIQRPNKNFRKRRKVITYMTVEGIFFVRLPELQTLVAHCLGGTTLRRCASHQARENRDDASVDCMNQHETAGLTDLARAEHDGFRSENNLAISLDDLSRELDAVKCEVAAIATEMSASDAQKPGKIADHAASETTLDVRSQRSLGKSSSCRSFHSEHRFEDIGRETGLDKFKLADFELMEKVGSGMCSTVHHAVHIESGIHVALKCYRISELSVTCQLHVKREVVLHSKLKHSNVTSLQGCFEDDKGNVYLVLEYAKRGDLFEMLHVAKFEQRFFPEKEVVDVIIRPIASALVHMHEKGIMHRDIKPENLLICGSGSRTEVKLSDFGFALDYKRNAPLSRLGTIEYMAPEVIACDSKRRAELSAAGQPGYGPEVDCWAIGVLVYECLYNSVPFPSENLESAREAMQRGFITLKNHISPEARDFILSCLDLNPKTRITARGMLDHPWLRAGAEDYRD